MVTQTGVLLATNIKGVAALFCLVVSISTAAIWFCYGVYMRAIYKLLLYVLVSTILSSLAFIFESAAADNLLLSDYNDTWNMYNDSLTDQVWNVSNTTTIAENNILCTISGAFLFCTSWIDVIIIIALVNWLNNISSKKSIDVIIKFTMKKTNLSRCIVAFAIVCFTMILFLLPSIVIFVILINAFQPWCQLRTNTDKDIDYSLSVGLLSAAWYGPTLVLTLVIFILLTRYTIKAHNLFKTIYLLREQPKDIQKDGKTFSAFILFVNFIIGILLIQILASFLYFFVYQKIVLLYIEATVIGIRGIAIIVMCLNSHTTKDSRCDICQLLTNYFKSSQFLINIMIPWMKTKDVCRNDLTIRPIHTSYSENYISHTPL